VNIAFDIDDTISRCPPLFAVLSRALRDAGHKVFIITFRSDAAIARVDLEECGVVYDELVTAREQDICGRNFNQWKAQVCRAKRIGVLFEDMPEVIAELDASTVAFVPYDPSLGKLTYVPEP
jgi:hypothetical protein